MKNTYSKDQLQEMAKPHFERLGVNKLYATSDGQFFLLENRAMLHAAGRNVYPLENDAITMSHTVAQDDLDNNPDLEGDEVVIPEPVKAKPAPKKSASKK